MMIRTRVALEDSALRAKLRGKIPKDAIKVPDCEQHKYPTTLLKAIPESPYIYLGIITEELLRFPTIDLDTLKSVFKKILRVNLPDNVGKASTTTRYLESVQKTRNLINDIIKDEPLEFDIGLSIEGCPIEGHPDAITKKHIFEIKTTGQLKQGWTSFLMQTFCYAALYSKAEMVHVVLPLQEFVWSWDVKNQWPKRNLYLDVMKN